MAPHVHHIESRQRGGPLPNESRDLRLASTLDVVASLTGPRPCIVLESGVGDWREEGERGPVELYSSSSGFAPDCAPDGVGILGDLPGLGEVWPWGTLDLAPLSSVSLSLPSLFSKFHMYFFVFLSSLLTVLTSTDA